MSCMSGERRTSPNQPLERTRHAGAHFKPTSPRRVRSSSSFAEKQMKAAFQIAILLITLLSALRAEDKPTFECAVGARSIKVFFADQEFDAAKHKIEHKEGAYGSETLFIDGHQPMGSDNLLPKRSWKRFAVFWDGKEIPVPSSLYERYYHPNINANAIKHRNLTFTIDPNGEWVQIIMHGSDGGGAYLVGWELRRDGQHVMIDPSELHQPPS